MRYEGNIVPEREVIFDAEQSASPYSLVVECVPAGVHSPVSAYSPGCKPGVVKVVVYSPGKQSECLSVEHFSGDIAFLLIGRAYQVVGFEAVNSQSRFPEEIAAMIVRAIGFCRIISECNISVPMSFFSHSGTHTVGPKGYVAGKELPFVKCPGQFDFVVVAETAFKYQPVPGYSVFVDA